MAKLTISCHQSDRCSALVAIAFNPWAFMKELLQNSSHQQSTLSIVAAHDVAGLALAHVSHWRGDHTRYLGIRKNLFDLRRMARGPGELWRCSSLYCLT